MNVSNINELPNEVLVLIFRRFDLLEKLKLRSVCLKWKWIIEHFRIKDVSVVDSLFNTREKWKIFGLESLNCQNLIYYWEPQPSLYRRLTDLARPKKLTGSLQLVSKHHMFSKLKSMFISLYSIDNFCFEKYINPNFRQLEQLFCFDMRLGKTNLSLPNLKVLSLFSLTISPIKMRLELPIMYKFLTNSSLRSFKFTHPESITHLLSPDDHESIVLLSNLEYFSCRGFSNESNTFSKLVKLKEIHLRFNDGEQMEKRYAEIYRAKQRLNRHDLKMFVGEVDYQTYLLRPSVFKFKDVLSAYVSGKMGTCPVVPLNSKLVYDDLLDALGSQAIPSDLKSSFPLLTIINASRRIRDDVDLFFKLLGNYPNLYILELESPFDCLADEQACYDLLPTCCKYLRELKVSGERTTPIDLNFAFGFRYLQKFEINQSVRSNFIQLLFEKLKYFRFLELSRLGRRNHMIEKPKRFPNKYLLTVNQKRAFILNSFASLLTFYLEKIEQFEFAD